MNREEAELRMEIDAIIRDEIQEGINEYVDQQEETEKTGIGFVDKEDEDKLSALYQKERSPMLRKRIN